MEQDERFKSHVLSSISNRVHWFDLLDRLGVLRSWLTSEHEEDRSRSIALLRMPDVFRARSATVAGLLRILTGGSDSDKQHVVMFISPSNSAHHSREMMDLFLELLDDGTLDDVRGFGMNGDWWLVLYEMSTAKPDYCSEAIGHWLDRQDAVKADRGANGTSRQVRWSESGEHVIKCAAAGAPLAFARELLPRVARAARGPDGSAWGSPIVSHARPDRGGAVKCAWQPRYRRPGHP